MNHLPLFHNLTHKKCLVIGGGSVATRKVRLLIDAKADVTVIAPTISEELLDLTNEHAITHINRTFNADDTRHFVLIVSACNDKCVNTAVSNEAQQRNTPVNVVDEPSLCTVIFPAIVDRSPMTIAISSGGAAPVLSRLTREKLETLLPCLLYTSDAADE